jgi:hypothetical protein
VGAEGLPARVVLSAAARLFAQLLGNAVDGASMPPSDPKRFVVIRLLEGQSEQKELVLEVGRPLSPLALGTRASWCVEGKDVAEVHVLLAWSGSRLFAGTTRGKYALLDGFPLAKQWTEVRVPAELSFGSVRLAMIARAHREEATVPPARRLRRDDEPTCTDDVRLQAALELVRGEEATCIADVVIPPEAKPSTGSTTRNKPLTRRPPVKPIVWPMHDSERTLIVPGGPFSATKTPH